MGKLFTSKLFKSIPHIFRVSEANSLLVMRDLIRLISSLIFFYVIEAMFLAILEVALLLTSQAI